MDYWHDLTRVTLEEEIREKWRHMPTIDVAKAVETIFEAADLGQTHLIDAYRTRTYVGVRHRKRGDLYRSMYEIGGQHLANLAYVHNGYVWLNWRHGATNGDGVQPWLPPKRVKLTGYYEPEKSKVQAVADTGVCPECFTRRSAAGTCLCD